MVIWPEERGGGLRRGQESRTDKRRHFIHTQCTTTLTLAWAFPPLRLYERESTIAHVSREYTAKRWPARQHFLHSSRRTPGADMTLKRCPLHMHVPQLIRQQTRQSNQRSFQSLGGKRLTVSLTTRRFDSHLVVLLRLSLSFYILIFASRPRLLYVSESRPV